MTTYLKGPLVRVATLPPTRQVLRRLLKGKATIFMLHRFHDPEYGVTGHSPLFLRRALAEMRRSGTTVIPLQELLHKARNGEPLRGLVAFTVDDGYGDFHRVGGPMFYSLDCPVTVFLPSGFLDRPTWQWWDRLRYLLERTSAPTLEIELPEEKISGDLQQLEARRSLRERLGCNLRTYTAEMREEVFARLDTLLGVEVPEQLPDQFAPMTWEQVRENGRKGVTFGPHTVSHRNMATLCVEEAGREIRESWNRIKAETEAAIPVLCYPFGVRATLMSDPAPAFSDTGIGSAVTAVPGYVSGEVVREDPFRVPRFAWPRDLADVRQITSGFEMAKSLVLGRRMRGIAPEGR